MFDGFLDRKNGPDWKESKRVGYALLDGFFSVREQDFVAGVVFAATPCSDFVLGVLHGSASKRKIPCGWNAVTTRNSEK